MSTKAEPADTDSLRTLHAALIANAADFRAHGHDGCALESEQIAARIAEAMKENR